MKLTDYLTDIPHPDLCLYLDLNLEEPGKIKSDFWSKLIPYSLLVDGIQTVVRRPVYLDYRSFKQLNAGRPNVNVLQSIKRNKRVLDYMLDEKSFSVFVVRHGESMNFRTSPLCDPYLKFYGPEPRISIAETGGCFQYLPFGRDRHLKKAFVDTHTSNISDQKDILVNAGFSLGVTPQRSMWAEMIEDQPNLTIDYECLQMGHYNQVVLDHGSDGCELYASKLVRSKFTLCPPSKTIDTTRFWDALSVGSIPLVLSTGTGLKNVNYGLSQIDDFYTHVEDLHVPFLILSPETFRNLTDKDLEEAWEEFLGVDWNFNCLTSQYWLDDMQTYIDLGPILRQGDPVLAKK